MSGREHQAWLQKLRAPKAETLSRKEAVSKGMMNLFGSSAATLPRSVVEPPAAITTTASDTSGTAGVEESNPATTIEQITMLAYSMRAHYQEAHHGTDIPPAFVFDEAHISAVRVRASKTHRESAASSGIKRMRSPAPSVGAVGGTALAEDVEEEDAIAGSDPSSDEDTPSRISSSRIRGAAADSSTHGRQARPVVDRVQRLLTVTEYRLDSFAYLTDRDNLHSAASRNHIAAADALKSKIVVKLRASAAAFDNALTYVNTDQVLEIDGHAMTVLAASHRQAATALEGQTIADIQALLIEGLAGCTGSRRNTRRLDRDGNKHFKLMRIKLKVPVIAPLAVTFR